MKHDYAVEIRGWDEKVQEAIYKVSPQKYRLIEQGVTQQDRFMLAAYPFASYMVKNGDFYLPTQSGISKYYQPENASKASQTFIGDNRSIFPFGIITKGCLDTHWNAEDRVIPLGLQKPSNFVGTSNLNDDHNFFYFNGMMSISSGVRSLALLPSIKDYQKYKKLQQKFNITNDLPKRFSEQYKLFGNMIQSSSQPWETEVLFFSRKTIHSIRETIGFSSLRNFVYKLVFNITWFDRMREFFDSIWEQFIRYIENQGIREKSYIYNFAKHIILVAIGEGFAFVPAFNDEMAPINFLKDAFRDIYQLDYEPTMIYAQKPNFNMDSDLVYCSWQYPIHLNLGEGKHDYVNVSVMDDLRSVRLVQEKFLEFMKVPEGEKCMRNSILLKIPQNTNFTYFHTVRDRLRMLVTSKEIISQNNQFSQINSEKNYNLPFCYSSAFFKGCVQIKRLDV